MTRTTTLLVTAVCGLVAGLILGNFVGVAYWRTVIYFALAGTVLGLVLSFAGVVTSRRE